MFVPDNVWPKMMDEFWELWEEVRHDEESMGFITSTQSLAFAMAIELSPRHLAATAVSSCNFLTMIVAAVLQIAVGSILTMIISDSTPATDAARHTKDAYAAVTPEDFMWAIAVMPALFLVAIGLCFLLRETHAGRIEAPRD